MDSWGVLPRILLYILLQLVINYLFQDKGPEHHSKKPGQIAAPVVTASASIPVLFGTKIMRQPNVVWYGDIRSIPWEQCYG
jgi:hypothetical protein